MSAWDERQKAQKEYTADMLRLIAGFTADIMCMDSSNLTEEDLLKMEKWLNFYRKARNKLCESLSEEEALEYAATHADAYALMGEIECDIARVRLRKARGEPASFDDFTDNEDEPDAQQG